MIGRNTRFTRDLDAASLGPLAEFRADYQQVLSRDWAGFSAGCWKKPTTRPAAVPSAYVMQPFEVRLDYFGRSWCTVRFELGHNEFGDADQPEFRLANNLATVLTEVGLAKPKPVPVMRADHQIAQKLHALSTEHSERARDLVDLHLLSNGENLVFRQIEETFVRLFAYRQQQPWPQLIDDAVIWVNDFIRRIVSGGTPDIAVENLR